MTAAELVDPTAPEQEQTPDAPPEPGGLSAELEALAPEPGTVVLTSGTVIRLHRMKTRQFFKLMRIITHGAGGLISTLLSKTETDEFVGQLAGMLVWAIPEAPEETIDFIRSMVVIPEVPGPFVRGTGQPSTEEGKRIQIERDQLLIELNDPELEDLVEILTGIVRNEGEDISSLGKRLRAMMEMGKKAGNL